MEIHSKAFTWKNVGTFSQSLDLRLTIIPVYRVNYIRAKARRDRWLEEFKLVPREMHWTMLYFQRRAETWDGLGYETTPGKQCYARRQAGMWRAFQIQALGDFQRSRAI